MMLVWILQPEAFGVGARMHILMLGYFIPMPPVTIPIALLLLINAMRMQRSKNMIIKLGTLNMEFSFHWSSLQLIACDVGPLYFTGV